MRLSKFYQKKSNKSFVCDRRILKLTLSLGNFCWDLSKRSYTNIAFLRISVRAKLTVKRKTVDLENIKVKEENNKNSDNRFKKLKSILVIFNNFSFLANTQHTHTYTHIHTHTHARTHTYTHTHIYISMLTPTYTHTRTYGDRLRYNMWQLKANPVVPINVQ